MTTPMSYRSKDGIHTESIANITQERSAVQRVFVDREYFRVADGMKS